MFTPNITSALTNPCTTVPCWENLPKSSSVQGRSVNLHKSVSSGSSSLLGKIFKAALLAGLFLNSARAYPASFLHESSAAVSTHDHPDLCPIEAPFKFESMCRIDGFKEHNEIRKKTSRNTKTSNATPRKSPHKIPQGKQNASILREQLLEAIISGKISEVQKLVSKNIDLNQPQADGVNFIHSASAINFPMAIKVLAEAGADVNAVTKQGMTPLHFAVMAGANAAVKMLISLGADLDKLSSDSIAPIHAAVFTDQTGKVLTQLLEAGATIDLHSRANITALHMAASKLSKKNIKVLQTHGANDKLFDDHGRTPFALCKLTHDLTSCTQALGNNGLFDEISDELDTITYLSHAWEMEGKALLRGQNIILEGAYDSIDFENFVGNSLKSFSAQNPGFLGPDEADKLSSILRRHSSVNEKKQLNQVLSDVQRGHPLFLHSGYSGHRVIVAIFGNYLIVANKGEESRKPIEVFKIDKEKVDIAAIQEIIEKKKNTSAFIHGLDSLKDRLNARSDPLTEYLEKQYPYLVFQMVGNCAFESIEAALCPLFSFNRLGPDLDTAIEGEALQKNALKKLDAALESYQIWVQFNRLLALENYLSRFKPNDTQTPWIDRKLVMDVFEKAWLITDWHEVNIEKLKQIEDDYKRQLSDVEKSAFERHKLGWELARAKIANKYPESRTLLNQL